MQRCLKGRITRFCFKPLLRSKSSVNPALPAKILYDTLGDIEKERNINSLTGKAYSAEQFLCAARMRCSLRGVLGSRVSWRHDGYFDDALLSNSPNSLLTSGGQSRCGVLWLPWFEAMQTILHQSTFCRDNLALRAPSRSNCDAITIHDCAVRHSA